MKVNTVTWFSGAGKSSSKESPVITLTDVLLESGLNFVMSLYKKKTTKHQPLSSPFSQGNETSLSHHTSLELHFHSKSNAHPQRCSGGQGYSVGISIGDAKEKRQHYKIIIKIQYCKFVTSFQKIWHTYSLNFLFKCLHLFVQQQWDFFVVRWVCKQNTAAEHKTEQHQIYSAVLWTNSNDICQIEAI